MKGIKKKLIILSGIIIFIILLIVVFKNFNKNDYKTINLGNNNLKTAENITDYILNISSYSAKVMVEVQSNKNTNKYLINQEYKNPNIFKQEVIEPNDIQGLRTIYDGNTLKIENTKIGLNKIYENYKYLSENSLCLYNFVENYKQNNNSIYKEENNQIIMETKIENNKNKYSIYKKLYIDKQTAKPIKLEVQDINQKILVYILYNEIKINSTNKEQILALN
ncbi:MAG: hypothetical protein HFJ53_05185 [Clostridia bacterium]|jgi:outer membrane lipoprotein-sorting protein|nr:hypothetical protein [Clostridia bacterium]